MYREIKLDCVFDQQIIPLTHFFAPPGCDSAFINAFAFIRDNQIFINTDDLTISFAAFAGAVWIVKAEKIRRRLFKPHSVQLKAIAKKALLFAAGIRLLVAHVTIALPLEERSLYRVAQTAY